jgi:cytidylate kinase
MDPFVITIDGPSSSGKGTVAKLVAKKLGFNYLDSGSLYRSVAYIVSSNQIDLNCIDAIIKELKCNKIELINDCIFLNNVDISIKLRDEMIGMLASKLAINLEIRDFLLDTQREFARNSNLVTDGRDMGSVVFPNATLKIFLTANIAVRANRRFLQLQSLGRYDKIDTILSDIRKRDEVDSLRIVAPLKFDDSYRVLDNTNLSVDETVNLIVNWYAEIINK